MIINVYCGTITNHGVEQVDDSATIQSVIDTMRVHYGVNDTVGTFNLNGTTLSLADRDKTFRELGVADECSLMHSPKADGGNK